jgi:hypothetical protein
MRMGEFIGGDLCHLDCAGKCSDPISGTADVTRAVSDKKALSENLLKKR